MTATPHDVTVRPLAGPEELGLFLGLSYVLDHELAEDLEMGRRRPEWMWVALREGRVLARLAWWTTTDGGSPLALDFFDLDDTLDDPERTDIGLLLLKTATAEVVPAGATPPEYGRFVPAGWREDPADTRVVEGRMNVLERSGARLFVERLRLEWRPGTPVPEATGRLRFRPADDREELIGLMTLVLEGTLDAHSLQELATMTARESATLMYEQEFLAYKSPHDWWTIAETPDGTPVGFVIPARNNYNPVIAYIGVLPAHRGHGYIDDLLAEGTRVLAAHDVPRIRAATDLANVPMAKAFARAGYVNFERALNMVWG
ncbi:GNAT family N-acetyltransferase [Streptomyces sp. NPDC051219]|uniref:GNAT family N-acetyltransferase n=1 Tax=Streptomyces sp. NPDC051219 TaxID=3155283 RepID=UPI00342CF7EA